MAAKNRWQGAKEDKRKKGLESLASFEFDPYDIRNYVLNGMKKVKVEGEGRSCTKAVKNDYQFINPYTFIPLDEKEPVRASNTRGNLTGVIECGLEVLSPTFIPNTTGYAKDEVGFVCYDFYSYDDLDGQADSFPAEPPGHPVIPGSEIRGMVRNVYEQLTNSCLPVIDEANIPFKRSAVPKTPYIMRQVSGQWELFKDPVIYKLGPPRNPGGCALSGAELDPSAEFYHSFDVVTSIRGRVYDYITELSRPAAGQTGSLLLHVTGPMDKKHHTLFDPQSGTGNPTSAGGINWPNREDALKRFELVLANYCDPGKEQNAIDAAVYYKKYRERYRAGETILVYADEDLTYLSPACMTKEMFEKSISSLLESQHKHNHCVKAISACPACRLFGMVGAGPGDGAIASRVRFADTYGCAEPDWGDCQPRLLPILASPKLSSTEFYLLKPNENADMWNYDYWNNWNTDKTGHLYQAQLAGRKVYWHGEVQQAGADVNPTFQQKVRCLNAGSFTFRLYFEDLSQEELRDLIFALRLNGTGIHKIGRGKPIGMGDVKVTVDKIRLRHYSWNGNTVEATWSDGGAYIRDLDSKKPEVSRIMNYTRLLDDKYKCLVGYPRNAPNDAIYKWFEFNRWPSTEPHIGQVLKRL